MSVFSMSIVMLMSVQVNFIMLSFVNQIVIMLRSVQLSVINLSIVMPRSGNSAEFWLTLCHYAECHCAKYHYAKCHYAQ